MASIDTKFKSLKKKYEDLKMETLNMLTKTEYLKQRKMYTAKKVEFLQKTLKKLEEIYDLKEMQVDSDNSDEELAYKASKPYKKLQS
mmetsp:Transcript_10974/g.12588  ORF Transcript_10974/g.12588 Transcript_10974/m.12588 type:complete len:87 (-) Transcript_10974:141-401(-)